MSEKIIKEINDVLVKLKFIGQAQKGKKVNFKDRTFIDASTWYGWFTRHFFTKDDQIDLEARLNTDVYAAIRLLDECHNKPELKAWKDLLLSTLAETKQGLLCLIDTYNCEGKAGTVSSLGVLVDNISIHISHYTNITEPPND